MYWPTNTLSRRNWNAMDRLFDEFDQMWRPWTGEASGTPRMNLWTNDDGAVVTAELPGVDPESLELSVHQNRLTISGQKEVAEDPGEEGTWHRHERFRGRFSRTVKLPFAIAAEHVKAEGKNGIVTIELPRAPEDNPRTISVSAA